MLNRVHKALSCTRPNQRENRNSLAAYIRSVGFKVFPCFSYFKNNIPYFMLSNFVTCSKCVFKVRSYYDGLKITMFNLSDLNRKHDRITLKRRKVKKEL